jgi:hypothetical protein
LWFVLPWLVRLLPAHTPERAQSKITKGQAKTNGYYQPPGPGFSGLVFDILSAQSDSADSGKCKENKARNLQPKLVQNAAKRMGGGPSRVQDGTHRPAASSLLIRHPSDNPQLAC